MGAMQPEMFANRAQDIMSQYPALDHQTVAALAAQPGNPVQNAQTVAQAIAQTWDGYEQTWSDPVLQSQPSVATGITQFIHNTIGPPPIDAGTIGQLQSALQADGLGAGLSASGAWTPDWQQAYNQAIEATKANQYAGQKPGSVKTSSALHGFLSHLTVTGALDAIGGWVKSIPDDARKTAGDVGGSLAGLAHVVTHPSEILGNSEAEKQTIATANRSIQNALGGHTTQQQQVAAQSIGHQLAVLNSALTFAGVAGVGKKAVEDIAANVARGTLEREAVTRTPGVIAKTLFNGNQNGRLLGSKWLGNLPGIARVTPMVGKLAGQDGYYYTARTMLAQPYKYAAYRAAGQAFSRTQLAGLGLYADALATSKLPGNTEAQDVLGNRVFDAIDHNIAQYGPRIFGQSLTDLNNLAFFLHGPVGLGTEGSASSAVGQHVQGFLNNFTDHLGAKGVPAAFQQATGMSRNDWLKAAGGDSTFLAAYMTSKVHGYAADWYADRKLGTGLHGASADQVQALTAAKKEYRNLPATDQAKVVQDMLASDPSMAYLSTRIKGDIARDQTSAKAAAHQSLADFKTTYEKMQQLHANGDLAYLMSPAQGARLAEESAFHNEANLPTDFGSARHLAELAPLQEGDIGLARLDTLTRGDVLNRGGIADQFQKALSAAQHPDETQAVVDAMKAHLFDNHNWDARRLGLLDGQPDKMLDAVKSEAGNLSAELLPTYDMPAATAQRINELKDLGYKLVVGDHLGDFYVGSLPDIGANNGWLTGRRKWAQKSGVDPTRVPDQEVGRATHQGIVDELAHAMSSDPNVTMNAYQTPATLMAMLREDGGVEKSLPWYAKAIFHGTSKVGLNKTEIDYLFKNGGFESPEQARAEIEQRMAAGLGPRDITRKAMFKALTTTHDVRTEGGGTWTWQGVDEKSANRLIRAVADGYRQPGYIMGWQAIENFARAGHGFPMAGVLAKRYPGSSLLQNVANWPNRVIQVRNRLRFTVSAEFDIRRWVKQSAKMIAEGVEPAANPLQRLIDDGEDLTAKNLLNKIGGRAPELNDQMDTDRQLAGRSIYGLYSPQWHAAYFVNELRKQGKSESEIKDAYNRTFKYGSGGGTSPLERSTNTVFFPFSFEKTLLRNFGGYLLDRPAQSLVLDLAVDEWRKMDKNATVGKFVQDHFPILWEMNLLNNAFTHGISPGELGGINAPILGGVADVVKGAAAASQPTDGQKSAALLNLFLPQAWGSAMSKKNLSRYLPVWNQFAKVYQSAVQQVNIGEAALYDVAAKATGSTARRPTLTAVAQQEYGTREKVSMADKLKPVLDFNTAHADDADKIKWLQSGQVPQTLWGQPINKTTIGEYVQSLYPAYDPASGTAYAQAQQRAEANFISQVSARDPAKGQQMASFAKGVNSVIGKINRDEYDPAQLAQIQASFRNIAQQQSRTDPDWMKLWSSYFAYALGPIVSPSGKAAA